MRKYIPITLAYVRSKKRMISRITSEANHRKPSQGYAATPGPYGTLQTSQFIRLAVFVLL